MEYNKTVLAALVVVTGAGAQSTAGTMGFTASRHSETLVEELAA
jgi:hypothetical protein